jgi:hypothetical protein
MTKALAPKAGFDWSKVKWGGPDDRRTTICSYCGAPFSEEDDSDVPLTLWTKAGDCAEFCEECQRQWWGMIDAHQYPERDGSD